MAMANEPFLKREASVRAARSLGIHKKRKSFLHILHRDFDALQRRIAVLAIHRNKFRQPKGRAHNRNIE